MASDRSAEIEPILRPRMPELDTIRGIAVLVVFLFHGFEEMVGPEPIRPLWQRWTLAIIQQGWTGVNLFFVLSGFLITGILLDSERKPQYYSRFYYNRVLRILPAYYLLVLLLFALHHTGLFPGVEMSKFLGLCVIYLANLAALFGVTVYYWPLWSLAVEEHFYLVWPTVVRFLSRRGLAMVATAICVIDPLLRLYAMQSGTDLWWAGPHRFGSYRYTWMSADGLAIGALLAIFTRSSWGSRKHVLKLSLAVMVASILLMGISFFMTSNSALCLRGTVVNYVALAMVAGCLWLGTGKHRKWVNIRSLSFYGFISYGLYLIHYLTIMFYNACTKTFLPALFVGENFGLACVRFAICVALGTGLAYLSRVTYEEYFLRWKDKSARAKASARAA